MDTMKQPYESPEVETVELKSEGIVCATGDPNPGTFPNLGEPIRW